ncbi:B3 domain-containing protein At2g33720-like [Hevea brasiliensis]|uniref:B3 domain-containing protein At2g33720-like n=1 Tax=Hevea brasiliensis TaxID=3981 RepID=UPI00260053F6|nr:B3 domain-containing protein At2g33720-like [Hevea brasiliensis]
MKRKSKYSHFGQRHKKVEREQGLEKEMDRMGKQEKKEASRKCETQQQCHLGFEISSSVDKKKSILSAIVVSTELKLFDETWIAYASATAKSKEPDDDVSKESSDSELITLARNTENEIICSPVEERKKRLKHLVWTKLALSDPWKIKKRLTGSDLGNLCRLLVASVSVKNHILPFLNNETVEEIKRDGARVPIWDCDTNTEQHLVLKYWQTAKSYAFINGWLNNFVNRRNLVEGDLIGIYWDQSEDIFKFSVLEKASDVYS